MEDTDPMTYTSPCLADAQAWIDLDIEKAAADDGRLCAMLDDDENTCAGFEDFEAAYPLIPRDRWPDLIAAIDETGGWLERRVRKVKDQGRTGMCVYFDLAQCAEVRANWHFGDDSWIELAPGSGYRFNAASISSGSNVGGSLTWLESKGLLPADTEANRAHVAAGLFTHVYPSTGFREKPTAGWEKTARIFRVHEWRRLNSVDAWMTALFLGFPCSGGRKRHAISHQRPVQDGRRFLSMYCNSWGTDFGKEMPISPLSGTSRGFAFDSEDLIRTMTARGAFCLCSMRTPPWHRAPALANRVNRAAILTAAGLADLAQRLNRDPWT
jgi:hypothetical protein